MGDISDPRLLYLKGALFVVAGSMAGAILLMRDPTLEALFLLSLCVWCFARAYYFAFYVIQHYVDGEYRFAGLWSFAVYLAGKRRGGGATGAGAPPETR